MPHHSFISRWYNVFNFSSVFSFSCHTVILVWYGISALGTGDQAPSDRVTLIQSHLSKRRRNASAMDVKGKMEFKAMSTKLSHQVRGHSKESRPIYLCESWRGKKIAHLFMQSLNPAVILWEFLAERENLKHDFFICWCQMQLGSNLQSKTWQPSTGSWVRNPP